MTARPSPARRGLPHLPAEDPGTPGTCVTCHRPLGAVNDRHTTTLPDNPGRELDARVLGEGSTSVRTYVTSDPANGEDHDD